MRVALIDAEASTRPGHLPEELCRQVMEMGHRALFCHSRGTCPRDIPSYVISCWMGHGLTLGKYSKSGLSGRVRMKKAVYPRRDRLGSAVNRYLHLFQARLSDRQGFFSKNATRRLVGQLKQFQPDVVHLCNLHGYYLHLPTLLGYLREESIPVVWTLNDCWAFTGHCLYPSAAEDPAPDPEQEQLLFGGDPEECAFAEKQLAWEGCRRWLTGCGRCAMKREYPESWLRDASARNWQEKRALLSGFQYLVFTAPSQWLLNEYKRSFLGRYPAYALPQGVDTGVFRPGVDPAERQAVLERYKLDKAISNRFFLLSVAEVWDSREGLDDLLALAKKLGEHYQIVAVGLEEEQRAAVPGGTIIALGEISNLQELCALYTAADLFVSMSRAEAVGTRLLEALSCGTQVLSWQVSALPEIITPETGDMAPLFDLNAAAERVRALCQSPKSPEDCRRRALQFDAGTRCHEYIRLYERMQRSGPAGGETERRPIPDEPKPERTQGQEARKDPPIHF